MIINIECKLENLTHIARSLHGNQSQSQLDASLPAPLKAAYDGLEVVFGAGNDGQ